MRGLLLRRVLDAVRPPHSFAFAAHKDLPQQKHHLHRVLLTLIPALGLCLGAHPTPDSQPTSGSERGIWRCAGRILYAERDSYLAPGIVVAAEALVRHNTRSQAKATSRDVAEGWAWLGGRRWLICCSSRSAAGTAAAP